MLIALTLEEKQRIFGPLEYIHVPLKGNPENIEITNDFEKLNIVTVRVPWSNDGTKYRSFQCHKYIAEEVMLWFEEMQHNEFLHLLLTFDGCYVPRLVRGGHSLSNHAFGTALDLNARWNGFGEEPAKEGEKGSVIEIVPIASKYGFSWGGNYKNRKDGMHFERALRRK
jgi:D-alanyl-D-alanine carboxypeptidase-like protein